MGLDMYLYQKTYVQSFHAEKKDIVTQVKAVDKQKKYGINPDKGVFITEEVGYWRKANAIHNFFITQTGKEDNCEPIRIPIAILRNLYERCKAILKDNTQEKEEIYQDLKGNEKARMVKVLKDDTKAKELLPTCEGFFFGSTEYDEWYVDDLERTIEILEPLINSEDGWSEFVYEASW